ncbi:MAG: RodZ domain-containing protein, partial [Chloroflexota bacterium]
QVSDLRPEPQTDSLRYPPEPEIQPDDSVPAAVDEFHPQWWERIRARVGLGSERARPTGVTEEAEESVSEEVESVEPSTRHSSGQMFAGIGAQLRDRRLALNLTREEIERHIRVRAHYLRALEEGDFDNLPSAVQTRGMLTNYAAFLDLDAEALLLRFADVLQARHRERHPLPPGARGRIQPAAPARLPPLRSFIAADLLGIVVLVALAAFTVWGVNRVMATNAEAEATSPSISEILLASTDLPTQAVTATLSLLDLGNITPSPAFEAPTIIPTFPEGITVQINIVATERAYLRVTVDGTVKFDGRTTPGSAYPFEGREQIEVLTGNGAALRVTFNSRDMGPLGSFGEVVNVIYTAAGVITPTATTVPSPTITPTPTITPSPTKTLVPSRTPTPP